MRSPAGWIERHAATTPHRAALDDGSRSLDYATLAGRVAGLADWLREARGLGPGARVAWLGVNRIEQLVLLLACAQARLVLVPLNWRLGPAELTSVLDDAAPALLVFDADCAALAEALVEAAAPCAAVTVGFAAAGRERLPERGAGVLRDIDAAPQTPVLLIYTSGTTGRARGAVHTRESLLFNALNAVHMHGMSAADRVLNVLPMFHVGGLNIQTLPALYCGAEVCLEPRFEPERCAARVAAARPSLLVLVPSMMAVLEQCEAWRRADLSSLRCVTTGSTDVPLARIEALHRRGVPVIQIWGATETGPVAVYQTVDEAYATAGTIGRAGLHSEVRLVDGGVEVVDGAPGELLVRGPHNAAGYWRRGGGVEPFAGGWFASGDVAERDAEGLYRFRDRKKHVIISGGENIYPAELERVLAASGLLREAAVAGRADERWGEVPVVVAVQGERPLDRERVMGLFEGRVARFKRPRDVVFVEALPRNAMGKVEVVRLRELARRR